jgi:hypothetical protein
MGYQTPSPHTLGDFGRSFIHNICTLVVQTPFDFTTIRAIDREFYNNTPKCPPHVYIYWIRTALDRWLLKIKDFLPYYNEDTRCFYGKYRIIKHPHDASSKHIIWNMIETINLCENLFYYKSKMYANIEEGLMRIQRICIKALKTTDWYTRYIVISEGMVETKRVCAWLR